MKTTESEGEFAAQPSRAATGTTPAWPTVEFGPGSRVVCDQHLDVWSERAPQKFIDWLDSLEDVPNLVFLGDLFDAWIGPAHRKLGGAQAVTHALRGLAERGTQLFLIPGNRDFLLDQRFEKEASVKICPHGLLVRLPRAKSPKEMPSESMEDPQLALLIHGDELCIHDHAYQRLRRVLRSKAVGGLVRVLPASASLAVARRIRAASEDKVPQKDDYTVGQDRETGAHLCAASGAATLVCGHAHRFRDEELGQGMRWIVLDAFGGARDQIQVGTHGELNFGRALGSGS